jgi:prepilin peptidase CpaA
MHLAASLTLIVVAAAAATSDVLTRRISNRLNLTILVLGLGWRAAGFGGWSLLLGVAGAATGLAILFAPFAVRWTGAGDVKLLAAFGAWLGPSSTVYAGLLGIAGGGLLAAALAVTGGAAMRRAVTINVFNSVCTLTAPVAPRRAKRFVVPMAVPFAVAAVATFFVRGGPW